MSKYRVIFFKFLDFKWWDYMIKHIFKKKAFWNYLTKNSNRKHLVFRTCKNRLSSNSSTSHMLEVGRALFRTSGGALLFVAVPIFPVLFFYFLYRIHTFVTKRPFFFFISNTGWPFCICTNCKTFKRRERTVN